jgi:uncharacterized protein YndB with AHSA1/START domain
MDAILIALAVLAVVAALAVLLVPRKVEYTESITVAASVADIYDAVRMQEALMQWSAWPSTTGSTCSTENADGRTGARTVYFSKGKRFGYQEVTHLVPNRRVDIALFSAGPPQKPRMSFVLTPLDAGRTRVDFQWHNELPRPFNLLLRLFGIVRWTRQMHVKDLDGLKRYCEPPHRTYTNEPAKPVARDA